MNDTLGGLLTLGVLIAALVAVHVPLGSWLARSFTSERHWCVELFVYRIVRVNPDGEQGWVT